MKEQLNEELLEMSSSAKRKIERLDDDIWGTWRSNCEHPVLLSQQLLTD